MPWRLLGQFWQSDGAHDDPSPCSDAFRVPADLGGDMAYPEDRTPFLQQPLVTANTDLERLGRPDPTAMGSRMADRVLALPYERQVCQAIHQAGSLVKLHVCGSTTCLLGQMATSGADLFNVDHLVPLDKARDAYAAQGKCYRGNLDPASQIMQVSPERCQALAHECLVTAQGTRSMLSAGCEIPAATPDEVLRAFCDAPKTFVG